MGWLTTLSKELSNRMVGTKPLGNVRGNRKKSIQNQDYRLKKKDALEGKDGKQQRSSNSESQGKGRSNSDRGTSGKGSKSRGSGTQAQGKGQSSSDRSSTGKGSKSAGSGSQAQSNIQSGQTTVQFSSGGGFGSLMALLSSSASLVRAEGGFILGASNQSLSTNLQAVLRSINNQSGSLVGDDGKNIREATRGLGQTYESSSKQFNLDIAGSSQLSRGSNALQDAFSNILKGISAQASEGGQDSSAGIKISIFNAPFTFLNYQGFNSNSFFFNPGLNFAFPNTSVTNDRVLGSDGKTIGFALSNSNPGVIDTYLKDAGITTNGTYTYQVLGPIINNGNGSNQGQIGQTGLTVARNGDLAVNVSAAPKVVTDQDLGITLTSTGDLYFNVPQPLSILVKIKGGGEDLVVRINAGPGQILDLPNDRGVFGGSVLTGLTIAGSDAFAPTVFRDNGPYKVVGSAQAITLNSPESMIGDPLSAINGNLAYIKGVGGPYYSIIVGSFNIIDDTYSFPSNTIFRHIGTSTETVPTEAAYGNFSSFIHPDFVGINQPATTYSTFTFLNGHSYNVAMGGNVLDVYGTKYGEGDVLNLNLATNPSAANTITMGGNTLAGFGDSYGDIQTLNVSALNSGHNSSSPTTLTFNGNVLWVDKNIGSILYPHLENLVLSNNLTDNSNLHLIFKDSLIHGNLGADTFYGDIKSLGDLSSTERYNGFLTGVTVSSFPEAGEPGGPTWVVTTVSNGAEGTANSITWGNNIYSGGSDSGPSDAENVNTYNFMLLGTSGALAQPVMLGNALITDFNYSVDTLSFELTPALFRSLDIDHNKSVTPEDMKSYLLQFTQDASLYNPFLQVSASGETITFAGGGSLSLISSNGGNFSSITNLEVEVNLPYVAVAPLPLDQIVTTTPIPSAPYIYGQNPNTANHAYHNELDSFFANSLFARYDMKEILLNGEVIDTLPAGVSIDQYGTITVTSKVPYFLSLDIEAITVNPTTHLNETAETGPLLFGFLDAPITYKPNASEVLTEDEGRNILIGGLNSTIIGGPTSVNTPPTGQGHTSTGQTFSYGSNLIVNTTASTTATAYGNFEKVILTAQGNDDISVNQTPTAQQFGSINLDTFEFKPNAFYVNGTVFGVAKSLKLEALGGENTVINFKRHPDAPVDVNASAHFDDNDINIGSQVIYGNGVGSLTGAFEKIEINVTAGAPLTSPTAQSGFKLPINADIGDFTGSINTSASFEGNTFTFGPTQITILGDSPFQTTINANVHDLVIKVSPEISKVVSPNLINISTATFADNHFIFGDANLKGGSGGVNFFGHLYNFGDAFDYTQYRGFVKGVTVSNDNLGDGINNNSHLTITDSNGNSIAWGNNTYAGGLGADTYNFAIIEGVKEGDVNSFAVMQGFDTITNFDLANDKIVLNLEKNLFNRLEMQNFDDQPTLAQKFSQQVKFSYDSQTNSTTIWFTGPSNPADADELADEFSFGSLTLSGIGNWTNLTTMNIQIISTGPDYTPPTANPQAVNTFNPVFVKGDQPLAFASFISNADLTALTWEFTSDAALPTLPSGISLSTDGTLHIFNTGDDKTPVDAFIQVTVNDGIGSDITIPSDPIHIFALNPDNSIITDPTIEGSIATEIYQTTGAAKIVGGGADIIYNPTTNPTTPGTELVYGSKLIYDISDGGHTAIGDVENIHFINTAATITDPAVTNPATGDTPAVTVPAVSSLDEQTITFKANMFNINSGGVGAIYGNTRELILDVNGGRDAQGNLINATINNNIFNFKPVTIYTVGSTTATSAGDSFTVFGNMEKLSFLVHNPAVAITGTVGNANIIENKFNFSGNKLVGSSDNVTLNPGIGVLNIENKDTATHDPLTSNLTPISGNRITFGNSTLIGGTKHTIFNADIADLSNSGFVTGTVTFMDDPTKPSLPVQVTDSWGNIITWGDNTYTVLPNSQSNLFNFTLLSLGGNDAAMQGHAKINEFRLNTDTLNLKLAPTLFKALDTNYDRRISVTELNGSNFTSFNYDGTTTTLSFASSLAAGSIAFIGKYLADYTAFGTGITTELAYTPVPVAVSKPVVGLTPQIFLADGGNGSGVYGNVLDNYFEHIDIGNAGSVYTVALSNAYEQLINPDTLFSASGAGALFDQYGTARPVNATNPILSIVKVTPTDIHSPTNNVTIDLMVGAFNGTMPVDTNTSAGETFKGSLLGPSYLQGKVANEILIGNDGQLVASATNQVINNYGATYGTDKFGGNMIINTHTGNTAYGVAKDILFSVDATSIQTEFMSDLYSFGSNAIYTNGAVFGVADKFLIEVKNSVNANFSSSAGPFSATFGDPLTPSTYSMGNQTIFGQGTLIGNVNAFQINVFGNTGASIFGGSDAYIDVSASVKNNYFLFAPTQITVLGDGHSSIFSHINSLSFFTQQGTPFIPQFGANQTLDNSANIMNNHFIFQDSIASGGSGGIDYYSDINDLSSTSFWSSNSVFFSESYSHISTTDNTNSSDHISNNTINWGNNKVYLSDEPGSTDTIHLNLLEDQNHLPGLPGKLDIHNFNLTDDSIVFNMSAALYKTLNGNSTTLNGTITAATLDNFVTISSGADTAINFDYGSLVLHGLSGPSALVDIPNIQFGTTLVGTTGADIFTVGLPDTISQFKEVDHIAQFNPSQDTLRIALSQTVYDQLSQNGLLSVSDLLNTFAANAGTSAGGITITQNPMSYVSSDPTNSGAADVDSTLNFVTDNVISGSITLHNVDMNNLNSSFVQVGQQGTSGSDVFSYVVSGNNFSTFTANTFITGFDVSNDFIQITLQKDLYNKISKIGTLSAASALGLEVGSSTGGIIATNTNTGMNLEFVTNGNTIAGQVTLDGVHMGLGGLGTSLHLGYIDYGTAGIDTFAFNTVTNAPANFSSFQQFNHIKDFDLTKDNLDISLSVDLFNALSANGTLDSAGIADAIKNGVHTSQGGIQVTTANGSSTLEFVTTTNNETNIFGSITLDGVVIPNDDITSLGSHLRFGILQQGTAGIEDTFSFNALASGSPDFSSFQQFDHIRGFDLNEDFLNITLPVSLFNTISSNGTKDSSQIVLDLTNDTYKTTIGDINLVSENGSTSLKFVDSSNNIYGSITLDSFTFTPPPSPAAPPDIDSFGDRLRFGSVQQGTSGADTFTYDHAANGTSSDLSAFKEFNHLIDFDTGADTLAIKITTGLYNAINDALHPAGSSSSAELAQALNTGMAGGQSINTQISVTQTGVDSILQFTTNGIMSGSITLHPLHNVSINHITDIPNLVVVH